MKTSLWLIVVGVKSMRTNNKISITIIRRDEIAEACTTSAVENDNRLSFFMRDLTTLNTYYNASVYHQQDGTPNWRWSATLAVQSVYKMYNNPRIIQTELSCLWDLKAPNKIKVFL
jgi:hypothetical protein